MTPARSNIPPTRYEQTAVPEQGSGCLSGFLLPPLAVIIVGALLFYFTRGLPIPSESDLVARAAPAEQLTLNLSIDPSPDISPLFTSEVQYWSGKITQWANTAGLDPNLVATIMQIESCGDPQALSRVGATGLFQVMPYHFATGENHFDPDTNALRGTDYMQRSLTAANDNPRLAFAGYNGGIGVIGRSESTWAAETVRYAYWGSGIYTDASQGASSSTRLDEWLQAGGASLCRQASQRLGLP